MPPKREEKPPAGRLQVNYPADLDPVYANLAMITHSPSEILMDFAQAMPQVPQARVKARVVMTPTNAKLLLRALTEHLAKYESEHGEIQVPKGTSLAEHLFKPPSQGEEGSGSEEAD